MFRFVVLSALVAIAASTPVPFLPRLDGRNVGGEDAFIEEYPHQLSLQSYGSHICGASIIGKKWAVTAAHCTYGSSASALTLMAGITFENDQGQSIKIAKIHQHPKYDGSLFDWDISVLELATEIQFGADAQPIALPADGSDPSDGTEVVCTGWGSTGGGPATTQLQTVTVQIVGRDKCNDQYGAGRITERMVCAGVPEGGKDACQGDSGGPLVADGKLVGVVSWGRGCGRPDYAGVYANVGALRSYITEISGL